MPETWFSLVRGLGRWLRSASRFVIIAAVAGALPSRTADAQMQVQPPRTGASARTALGVALDTTSLIVRAIQPGSPAARAGLAVGDSVTRINGQPAAYARFTEAVARLSARDSIVLTVSRRGASLTILLHEDLALLDATAPVTRVHSDSVNRAAGAYLSAACAALDSLRLPGPPPTKHTFIAVPRGCTSGSNSGSGSVTVIRSNDPHYRLALNVSGMYVLELAPALATALDVSGGLLVTEVEADSVAARVGFRAGDIIVRVNGRDVKNMVDLLRLRAAGGTLTIIVRRQARTVTLRLPVQRQL